MFYITQLGRIATNISARYTRKIIFIIDLCVHRLSGLITFTGGQTNEKTTCLLYLTTIVKRYTYIGIAQLTLHILYWYIPVNITSPILVQPS